MKRTHGRGLSSPQSVAKRRQLNSPYVAQGNACCCICQDKAVQLVQLGACPHAMCRGCTASHLLHALKLGQLQLACPLPLCRARLRLQPALQLLEQQAPGSGALAAKVLLAAAEPLALIPDDLVLLCPYPDCMVPLELGPQLPDLPSDCPCCHRPVCGSCRSRWHANLSCAQYQALAAGGRARGGAQPMPAGCGAAQHQPLTSTQPPSGGAAADGLCGAAAQWQHLQAAGAAVPPAQPHLRGVAASRGGGGGGGGWPPGRSHCRHRQQPQQQHHHHHQPGRPFSPAPSLGSGGGGGGEQQDAMAWSPAKHMAAA